MNTGTPTTTEQDITAQLRLARPGFVLDVDLRLPGRGISVLFGPSGSGKTTLLRCLAGLEPEASGQVLVGHEVWQSTSARRWVPTHRRALGYVFQEASLFEHLNVRQNIEFGLRRTPQAEASRLDAAIRLLGIGHLLERPPQALSGGERQRVAIARALATQPQLLLLDEPLAALDPARKQEVLPWLERLRDELRIPMVYVTHSMDELTRLGDTLVLLAAGRVQAVGPLAATLSTLDASLLPGQEPSVLLDATVSALDAAWHLARLDFPAGCLWVRDEGYAEGDRLRLRLLARDVSLALREPEMTSIQNHLQAHITGLQDDVHPSQWLVRLDWGGQTVLARITRRAWHQLALAVGQTVWAQVKSVAVAH